ncbi:hypothetical protein [Puniceicoccus vermicola]|uniref:Uncharacterized protein n=1 Tax=Puniceicoccus vermicola TaxID=388746 RepID=A0A7X1E6L6_9BACT|nr:hypothetical protein [Puniceicoccus vermicola]MBC2604233.1 hypothetical protein [Puniceicoccus vermicola]
MVTSPQLEKQNNLKRNRSLRWEKPYNPALIPASLDSIQCGDCQDNTVYKVSEDCNSALAWHENIAEQYQIVAKSEARTTTTTIDHLDVEFDRKITRSNRLRHSTLAAAFSGRI